MTDRDIQTVEAVLEAYRRGDVDALLDLNHPDAEWVNPDYAIEPGTRRASDGPRGGLAAEFGSRSAPGGKAGARGKTAPAARQDQWRHRPATGEAGRLPGCA